MSDTKWTKAPWYPFIRMETGTFAVFGPENDPKKPVIEWTGFDDTLFDVGKKRAAANATLIATAPRMYEALQLLINHARSELINEDDIDFAENVLAQARGEDA